MDDDAVISREVLYHVGDFLVHHQRSKQQKDEGTAAFAILLMNNLDYSKSERGDWKLILIQSINQDIVTGVDSL